MPIPTVIRDPDSSDVDCRFHYKCAVCFGIVGTDYPREEVRCICGGRLEEIPQPVEKKGKK